MSYQPDGLGRATRASDAQRVYASNAAYHPSGGLTGLSYGNGLTFSASYNARQLMSAMQVSGGGTTAISFVYGRDPNGRITAISDLAVSGQYRTFGYDGLGRLVTATGPWGSGSYTYHVLGNLTTRTLGSRVVEMEYNASNRLHRHRDTADGNVWRNYAYDSRGNVTNNGSISFTYDRAERPVSISGAASGSFVYDAHGRRVKQVTGGQTIYSVYSSGGTLLYRDNATTSTATDYIRMGGRAIARVRGSHVEWTHADHLGSPAAATSAAGAVLWREDHTPFGEARQGPTQNVDNEGFTGHIADAASGLVYMQARYYDPLIGRFLSSDPVGFATGGPAYFNRYAYTANDPVNMVDPTGMASCPVNTDCIAATNYRPDQAGTLTVTQSANIDAAAVHDLPHIETTGNLERGMRFDEDAAGNVTGTEVPTVSSVSIAGVINTDMYGIGGADAIGHSHPNDNSGPAPGPGDDAAVLEGYPNNIVNNGNVVVVEIHNGQFHVRVLNDNNLTSNDRREIQRAVNLFQTRLQQ